MATLGATGKPSTTQEGNGLNNNNATVSQLTLPSGGPWKITHVGCWLAGWNATPSTKLVVYVGNNYRRATASFSIYNGGNISLGEAQEYYKPLTSPLELAGGTAIRVGFVRDPAESAQFPMRSGTHYDDTQTGTWPKDASWSSDSGELGAYITYEAANSAPTAPSGLSPTGGAIVTDLTPSLQFDHNDPDGDGCVGYDIQVDNNSDLGSPLWDLVNATSGISGDHIARGYNGPALNRGTTYYWRARTRDNSNGAGAWSSIRSFKINSLPVLAKTSPLPNTFAEIWNLVTDLAVWTTGGAHAKPRFKWSFSDADGDAQTAYQLRIWNDSGKTSLFYDSGVVSSSSKQHDCTVGLVRNQIYYWSIDAQDSHGEWYLDPLAHGFKVQWGQAIYEYAVPGGVNSRQWAFTSQPISAGLGAFLFATATGAAGAGRSAWTPQVSTLTPDAFINVLVRLQPAINATSGPPLLPKMTFNYLGAALVPDRWVLGTVATDWSLDSSFRRFGSQSLRLQRSAATGLRYAYPFTNASGDDVSVSPETDYILSGYVNTNRVALGSPAQLAVYDTGADPTTAPELSALYTDATERETYDSTDKGLENWQRLFLKFKTEAQDRLRLVLQHPAAGSVVGNKIWFDALQLEEASRIPTPWRPGMVAAPTTLGVEGVTIDASKGGILRVRGVLAGVRDTVELGQQGLVFGGDTELASPSVGRLDVAGYPYHGLLAFAETSGSNQNGISAIVDVTGLTGITFTLPSQRRLKVTVFAFVETTAAQRGTFDLYAVGNVLVLNNVAVVREEGPSGSSHRVTAYGARTTVQPAGSYNWKIRASTPTGGFNIVNSLTPAWCSIEDMGPA